MKHSTILGALGIALICDILLIWCSFIYGIPFLTDFSNIYGNTLAVCLGGLIIIIITSIVFWILYKFINYNEGRK
jgi:uncharacterized membrane protein